MKVLQSSEINNTYFIDSKSCWLLKVTVNRLPLSGIENHVICFVPFEVDRKKVRIRADIYEFGESGAAVGAKGAGKRG